MISGRPLRDAFPLGENIPQNMLKILVPLQDLKRQQPAHYTKSIASTLFVESWERFFYGENLEQIALKITAKALISVIIPGCDALFFAKARLDKEAVKSILIKILTQEYQAKMDAELFKNLLKIIPDIATEYNQEPTYKKEASAFAKAYPFVNVLCRQPRAGATKPCADRLLLLPPEMHSDHCLITAVYAVLFSESFDAAFGLPFFTGLSHHLHNAVLPDCGFAGEIALGDHLEAIMKKGREEALKEISGEPLKMIWKSINNHEDLTNPEGRASSAADVLDRVLDIKWRVRAASVTEGDLLEELELVHEGPVKNFQTQVLKAMGI